MWDHTPESKARAEQWAHDTNAAAASAESRPAPDSDS
jgi:hypothetical protein